MILAGILRVFRSMRHGNYDEAELERQLNNRGLFSARLRPLDEARSAGSGTFTP